MDSVRIILCRGRDKHIYHHQWSKQWPVYISSETIIIRGSGSTSYIYYQYAATTVPTNIPAGYPKGYNDFYVMKLLVGEFKSIGTVMCNTLATNVQFYSFEDTNPLFGANYFGQWDYDSG